MSTLKQELHALRMLASQYEYHWQERWERAADKVEARIVRRHEAALAQIKAHEEVIAEHEDWQKDVLETQFRIVNEECVPDEKHCSCVPALRKKIAELGNERTALLEMTRLLDEHPEGYDGPCECKLCLSYVDCEGLDFDRTEGG